MTCRSQRQAEAPSFNAAGELERPADFREWVYLTTGLDMFYGPAAQAPAADGKRPSVFTNVYVTPPAYREFMKSGTWPDKTMFILEVRRAESAASIDNVGKSQGALLAIEVGREGRRALRRQRGQQRLGLLQLRREGGLARRREDFADVRNLLLVPRGEHRRRQHLRAVLPHAVRGREAARHRQAHVRPRAQALTQRTSRRSIFPRLRRTIH